MSDTPPTSTTSTVATAAEQIAALQAQLAALNAEQTAADNAKALSLLTPLAFMSGPTWASYIAAIKANWWTVMSALPGEGQGLTQLLTVMENVTPLIVNPYLAAGGVAATT